ncbi:MAG: family 16 glycosylhydrolase [Ignavibacteriales bacterium]|nr:family 16 glycosylhydrolase [Ignavibacteriales bacterium]MCF8315800.1 family 16 glycosylhydrolase [Ignavibacteriales bacterium]MCF8437260.1 family 16 glycosylhydrolase [Ignavibacteriales bacterium]
MIKYLVVLLLFYGISLKAQFGALIWSDEFENDIINTDNWTYDLGGHGWGNQELQYYTNRNENATVKDGNLLIIGREESFGGRNYTSARLKTLGLHSFLYGRIEARIKIPLGQGYWGAFWLLGDDFNGTNWPQCGEIDIMEHISNSSVIRGTAHWDNNGYMGWGQDTPCDVSQYHVFSVEWNEKAIKWFLDGNKYYEINILNGINGTSELHLPFHIILNLAIGGSWPGNPDETTQFPDTMFVDYVRVYKSVTDFEAEDKENTPSIVTLGQNYPNPFNPKTNIEFEIETPGVVKVTIYNSLGKLVGSMDDGFKSKGKHSIAFDGSNLASGLYYYRLQVNDVILTRKMVLIK